MKITAGSSTATGTTVTTNIASTPSGTGLFSGVDKAFPNWNMPDPSAYQWTLPNTSHWYNFAQNISSGVFSFVANTLLELISWILHIAILISSKFSDPSWITDPVVSRISGVFKSGYNDVFVKFLPVLMMSVVGYLCWKYVVGHHVKMLTGILSTLLATGLVTLFFFDFGNVFSWVNGAGNLITDTASAAVASTAGTSVGSEYDVLWDNYVLYVWEYGQFGQISGNINSFNVNPSLLNNPQYTYQLDPTVQNPNPGEVSLPTTEMINGVDYPTNWVRLYLDTTNSTGRSDLENILTTAKQPFASGSMSDNAVLAANPFSMIPFLVIELILLITPVIFLCYVGFQLFVRELLFIVTVLMGIVTVPMAFVPEIGWRITVNWVREAVGHQVERLGNAIYAALLFSVAGIITVSIGSSEASMMLGFLVDSILFAAAMIYRQKVFSIVVHPMGDSVRGVETNPRDLTMDEYIDQRLSEGREHGGKGRTLRGATISKPGKLSEHFAHMEVHEEHHHMSLPSGHRVADTPHVRANQPSQLSHDQKSVSGHLADSFKDGATATKHQKFARNASDLKRALGNAIEQHLHDVSDPEPPLSHEERIRRRELRARGLEGKLHRHSVKTLHRSVSALMSRPKLSDAATPPDDNPPPPSAPPFVDDASDRQRKVMVSHDGRLQQGVVVDKEGREIAIEAPVVSRPRREATEINAPKMADTFSVRQVQDEPADSVREQASQPVSVAPLASSERVGETNQPGQPTLPASFTAEPQNAGTPTEPGQGLSPEKPASDKGENGTFSEGSSVRTGPSTPENDIVGQSSPRNVPELNFEAVAPVSTSSSQPAQLTPLPPNVTRIETEREHRAELEGRQREQRTQQRTRQAQGRRRAVRVNERSPRRSRPRGPEL